MQTFLTIVLVLCFAALGVCIMMLRRVNLVYGIKTQILKECSAVAKAAIENGGDWEAAYAPYDNLPSYDRMMWQLTKWNRKQFRV